MVLDELEVPRVEDLGSFVYVLEHMSMKTPEHQESRAMKNK